MKAEIIIYVWLYLLDIILKSSCCIILSCVSNIENFIFLFGFLGDSSFHGALLCRPQRRVWVAGDTQWRGHSLQTLLPLWLPWTRLRLVYEGQYLPPTMPWWCDGPLPTTRMVLHSNTWWGLCYVSICLFAMLLCFEESSCCGAFI